MPPVPELPHAPPGSARNSSALDAIGDYLAESWKFPVAAGFAVGAAALWLKFARGSGTHRTTRLP